MNRINSRLQIATLSICFAAVSLFTMSPIPLHGQDLTGDDLFLTGGGTNQPDIFFNENEFRHSICMRQDFLRFFMENDTETANNRVFELNNDAPNGAAGVYGGGFGIGTSSPTAPLHVFAANSSAYPEARILVQNTNTAGLREMLRLENNGGVGFRMVDTSTGTFFKSENVLGTYEIASGPVHFRIDENSTQNALNLAATGIGIGTDSPISTLHILADGISSDLSSATIRGEVTNAFAAQDRLMLDLRNNGGVVMNLLDTSAPGAMPYQIRSSTGSLSLQQFGGNRAGMVIFNDGAIRYVANGVPNVTVRADGTMNIIGQSGGGNLNVLGPDGGAGNLFVKGNITLNGTINGPSDRNIKENFKPIDAQEILAKVANLPITQWNYKSDKKETPHVGPMAQDFAASFQIGDSDKHISLMDSDGIALAAIQGLNKVVEAKDKRISELNQSLQDQSVLISDLTERLERLEAITAALQQ